MNGHTWIPILRYKGKGTEGSIRGKKVALIVNDVETAKKEYKYYSKKDLMYYVFILNLQ